VWASLGLTYTGKDDAPTKPGIELCPESLSKAGANVRAYDPIVEKASGDDWPISRSRILAKGCDGLEWRLSLVPMAAYPGKLDWDASPRDDQRSPFWG